MRSIALFVFIVFAIMPVSAFAATPAAVPPCFMKESKDPSGSKAFPIKGASPTVASDIRAYMQSVSMCPSACWSEVITMNFDAEGTTINVKGTSLCNGQPTTPETAAKLKLGCGNGLTSPKIQVNKTGSVKKLGALTFRCDTKAMLASLDVGVSQGATDAVLQGLAQNAADNVDLSTPLGKEQTAGVLKAFGVSDADATNLVENKPDETKALLQAFASGDQTKVEEAAKSADVTLNPDLSDISNMSPKDVSDKFTGLYTPEQKQTAETLQTTGFNPPVQGAAAAPPGGRFGEMFKRVEDQYGNSAYAPGVLAKFMKVETGGNCNSVSPTGPAGCFQYSGTTWDKWSAAINNGVPLDRSLRYDPEVSAKVTANYIATNWAKYGDMIQQSGMDPAAALYAIHNIGDGGGPKFIQAFANNPNALVSDVLDQNSIRFNPGLYRGGNITLAQAQQNMVARMEGSTNFAGGSLAQIIGSPFGAGTRTGWDYYSPNTPYGVSASPFGNVFTPVSTGGPVSTGSPVSTGGPISTGAPVSTGGVISTGGTVTTGTGTALPAAQPVASIIVQPTSTRAGNPVSVSWSSYGMSASQPCQVFAGQSFMAQGNEGTRTFSTNGATTSIQFLVQCFAPNGSPIKQTASVLIR